MRAKEVLEAALKATGLSQAQVAKMAGIPEQSLGQKVNIRESVRANEFFELLDVIGIDTIFYVRETGEILMKKPAHGRRVIGMSDGIVFDTKESTLVASSFFADGTNEYGHDGKAQELYTDSEGRYFVAEYSNDKSVKDRVRTVPADMAAAFINLYGINKESSFA